MDRETLEMKEYFEDRYERFGTDLKSLAWNSPESQQERFEILSTLFVPGNFFVLDVGCGFGDYYKFLKMRMPKRILGYTGIDLVQEFITEAETRYPGGNFRVLDILASEFMFHNYVVASGIFSKDVENWYDYVTTMLTRMFSLCTKGIAANFLSKFSPANCSNMHYADPAEILEIAFTLSKKVILRHDYRLNDFTVFIYK
jgi:trans-aconitate methyltransferase